MASSNFSTSAYIEVHTLTKGHSDTINSLAYSRDGVHLASGGDDHLVIIWNAQKAQLLYRLVFESAVDCVIWHPVHPETVIVGLETGYIFQLHDFCLRDHQRHDIRLGVRSTVHCMDYDTQSQCLAIGMGEEVHITREKDRNVYEGDIVLPSPSNREDQADDFDDRMRAVAVQFDKKDSSHLIVSYLAHGVICWDTTTRAEVWKIAMPSEKPSIGGSALSPNQRNIAVYNLLDGLDLYAAGSYGKQRPRKVYKFNKPQPSKHALQVQFTHYGTAIVCGTTTGGILLWEVATGDALQELNHAEDIVQAVAVATLPTASYIATGVAAKGQKTYIKIWRAKICECGHSVHASAPPLIKEYSGRLMSAASSPGNPEYQVSDAVVDLVQAVTENRLFQPSEAVRHGMAIAVTVLLCLFIAWLFAAIPWLILRRAVCIFAKWSLETFLGAMATAGERSMAAAHELSELWSAFIASTSASMRRAVLTFLFPERLEEEVAAMVIQIPGEL